MNRIPFRIGTTSFIYGADILTNVKKLAPVIDDVELVLFETGENDDALPTYEALSEMNEIAAKNNTSYTVHLPLLLGLGDGNKERRSASIDLAVKIIDLTSRINPWAYIIHLNTGKPGQLQPEPSWEAWLTLCCESILNIASSTVNTKYLCIENLSHYDITHILPLLDMLPVSLCLDVGHLWAQGVDPVPFVERYRERIRVVHIHGINKRDHASLEYIEENKLARLLDMLEANIFRGVITIEVFDDKDLESSIKLIRKWSDSLGNLGTINNSLL
jgi:sugar phosphate isomerase/epimerase